MILRWILYPWTFKGIVAWINITSYPATISTACTYPVIVIKNIFFGFSFFICFFLGMFSFSVLFEEDGWSQEGEFLSTWSCNISWQGIIFCPLLLICLLFSAPMPQFSFRKDSTESLNNGEFISSDSLFEHLLSVQ